MMRQHARATPLNNPTRRTNRITTLRFKEPPNWKIALTSAYSEPARKSNPSHARGTQTENCTRAHSVSHLLRKMYSMVLPMGGRCVKCDSLGSRPGRRNCRQKCRRQKTGHRRNDVEGMGEGGVCARGEAAHGAAVEVALLPELRCSALRWVSGASPLRGRTAAGERVLQARRAEPHTELARISTLAAIVEPGQTAATAVA